MKRTLLIILSIISNLLMGQESKVKFLFTDTVTHQRIKIHECSISYNAGINVIIYPDSMGSNGYPSPASYVYVKPGVYAFHVRTKEYKDIIISNVDIFKDKITYAQITAEGLVPKKSKNDNDTIKVKQYVQLISRNVKPYMLPQTDKNAPKINLKPITR